MWAAGMVWLCVEVTPHLDNVEAGLKSALDDFKASWK